MTREEIIRMAQEAWNSAGEGWVAEGWFSDRADALVEFYSRAAEKERTARIAAKSELNELKEALAKSGLAHRRAVQEAVSEAVAEEREACRTECQALADILREHNDISGAELAESLAEAIAARGAA